MVLAVGGATRTASKRARFAAHERLVSPRSSTQKVEEAHPVALERRRVKMSGQAGTEPSADEPQLGKLSQVMLSCLMSELLPVRETTALHLLKLAVFSFFVK